MTTRTLIQTVPWDQTRLKRAVANMREIGAELVMDETHNALDTWTKVLRTAGVDSVIILEDDVVLTDRWRDKIEAAIAEHPDDVIQFFSLRKVDAEQGSRWMPGSSFLMNQCHYFPQGAAADLLGYIPTWLEEHPDEADGHDYSTARWLASRKKRYWLHVPSLVQHEGWTSEIHPRRPRNRQSRTFQ